MVDVSKLTPAQRQQYAVILLHHYHELCNTNEPSLVFVSPPPISNIESLYQSTISSVERGLSQVFPDPCLFVPNWEFLSALLVGGL